MVFNVKHLGCRETFEKLKHSPLVRFFSGFSRVSEHCACLYHKPSHVVRGVRRAHFLEVTLTFKRSLVI